jgi:hypothetical protein
MARRSKRAPLRALVKGPATVVPVLDQVLAEAAGVLCGRAGTSDVIDAAVVAHGGEIVHRETPGGGASVDVDLPLHPPARG